VRVAVSMRAMDSATVISIRVAADPDDHPFPELTGPVLLAEEDGHPVAAVDLESGHVAEDSRRSSSGLIALLQLHRLEARLIGALVGG
jgi:hypothetical protein